MSNMEGEDRNQFTPPGPSCTVGLQVKSSGETGLNSNSPITPIQVQATTDNFLKPLAGSVTDTLTQTH